MFARSTKSTINGMMQTTTSISRITSGHDTQRVAMASLSSLSSTTNNKSGIFQSCSMVNTTSLSAFDTDLSLSPSTPISRSYVWLPGHEPGLRKPERAHDPEQERQLYFPEITHDMLPSSLRHDKSEFVEDTVHVGRVSKVTKYGKVYSFNAIVVVGNGKGVGGFGFAKGGEIPTATSKAAAEAHRNLIQIPLYKGKTIFHDIESQFCKTKVILRRAPLDTGFTANNQVMRVLRVFGIEDCVTKVIGSRNHPNVIRAVFKALEQLSDPEAISSKRGKLFDEIESL
eukprot:TRINITY_DN28406_c0_g1_i1.p1 TRINITY_DN28406_c0_g1~~TRINITY_DN28406_c0_g1_i1.p1  ORF type:complete len:298 (-),score=69.10 TRINITY_DN28406_c0_g1_i1:23-877(-)